MSVKLIGRPQEIRAVGGLTYRFERSNLTEHKGCELRRRYDSYVILSNLIEQETICSTSERQYGFLVQGTF